MLKLSKPQLKLLRKLVDVHPEGLDRSEVKGGVHNTLASLKRNGFVPFEANKDDKYVLTDVGEWNAVARGWLPRWDDEVRETREELIKGLKPDEVMILDAVDDPCIYVHRDFFNMAPGQGCTEQAKLAASQNLEVLGQVFTRNTIRRLLMLLSLARQGEPS